MLSENVVVVVRIGNTVKDYYNNIVIQLNKDYHNNIVIFLNCITHSNSIRPT